MTWVTRRKLEAYMFLLPGYILFLIIMVYPALSGLRLSFYQANAVSQTWIGLANYRNLLHDSKFHQSLLNAGKFMLAMAPGNIVAGLVLALLIWPEGNRVRAVFRGAFYLPVVVSGSVLVAVFLYLAHPHYGLLNWVLGKVNLGPVSWLGDPRWAWLYLTGIDILCGAGSVAIIFLAALDAVSRELLEAAAMDGAGWWAQLWHIRLPAMRPILLFVTITQTMGALMVAELVILYTGGGPVGSTMTPCWLLYNRAFGPAAYGEAATIGVFMLAIAVVMAFVEFRFLKGD